MRLVVITAATLFLGAALTVTPLAIDALPHRDAIVITFALALVNAFVHFELGRANGLNY